MKIKRILLASLLMSGVLMASSCSKKKPVEPTPDKTKETTEVPPVTTPELPTSTYDDTPTTSITIDIDPITEESSLMTIYNDFNKPKLPTSYTSLKQEQIISQLKISPSSQANLVKEIDCIEQKGIDYTDDGNIDYLVDAYPSLSEDDSYYGNVLNGVVVDFEIYIENLLQHENNKYGQCSAEYYVSKINDKNYFLISIKAYSGINHDLIVVDSEGIISYINFTDDSNGVYETNFVEKGTLNESDLETLQRQGVIKYNNDGCEFKIKDYNATSIFVPGYYRTKPFQNMDLSNLDYCNNLEEIVVPNSNTTYKTIDGILYSYDLTELLYYPKAKQTESYIMPETVENYRKGTFKNLKYLKELSFNENITKVQEKEFENSVSLEKLDISSAKTIGDSAFKNCLSLKELSIYSTKEDGSIASYFQTDSDDNLSEIEINEETYYVPKLEKITILNSEVSNLTFLGMDESLIEINIPSATSLNDNNFKYNLINLEKISIDSCKTIGAELFKNLEKLTTINGSSFESIGDSAFNGCTNLEALDTSNVSDLGVDVFTGTKITELNLPKLTVLKENQFKNSSLVSILLPNVTEAGASVFEGSTNLENIDLSSLTVIPKSMFRNLENLTTIELGAVSSVGQYAFYCCKKIETLSLENVSSIPDYAFYYCAALKSIDIPNAEDFGISAFSNCKLLETINCKPVKTISSYSFSYCYKLKYLDISQITKLPQNVFSDCKALDISITNKITYFGECSLSNCQSIKSFDLSNATYIGSDAFKYTNITSANLSKVETLSSGVFYKCEKLEKVTLPSTIDKIENYTFSNCISLTTINLSNVKTIAYSAFYGCKNLKNVDLSKVTYLGDYSFSGCSSLNSSLTLNNVEIHKEALCNTGVTTLTVGGNSTIYERGLYSASGIKTVYITGATTVKRHAAGFNGFTNNSLESIYITGAATIEDGAFGYATNLKTFQETNGNVTYGGSSIFEGCTNISDVIIKTDYSNRLFVGATIPSGATIDYGITSISDYNKLDLKLFDRVKLNSITGISSLFSSISTTIKYFEARSATSFYYASSFKDKTQLEEVVLPKITKILYSTFQGCTSLKTVDISAATVIGNDAFEGCTSLSSIYAPNMQTIDYSAFEGCTKLSSISLNNCTELGSSVFWGCTSLTSIYAPSISSVNYGAFSGCTNLQSFQASKVTSIGKYAFDGCSKLKTFSVGNVTAIKEYAFRGCSLITTIPNGSGLIELGKGAFQNCTSLTGRFTNANLTSILDETFDGCTSMDDFVLENVTSIGNYAFRDCANNKTSLSITAYKTTTVGDYAFYNSRLTHIAGTPNLTSIGQYAFAKTTMYSIELNENLKATNIGANAFADLRAYSNYSGTFSLNVRIRLDSTNYTSYNVIGESTAGRLFTNNIEKLTFWSSNASFTELDFRVLYLNNTYVNSNYYYNNVASNPTGFMWTFELFKRS